MVDMEPPVGSEVLVQTPWNRGFLPRWRASNPPPTHWKLASTRLAGRSARLGTNPRYIRPGWGLAEISVLWAQDVEPPAYFQSTRCEESSFGYGQTFPGAAFRPILFKEVHATPPAALGLHSLAADPGYWVGINGAISVLFGGGRPRLRLRPRSRICEFGSESPFVK